MSRCVRLPDWRAVRLIILNRCRRAVKRRGKGFRKQSAKERHRLRIALKKQRYAIDA